MEVKKTTEDHNLSLSSKECNRLIEAKAGASLTDNNRLQSSIAPDPQKPNKRGKIEVSRSFGDYPYKVQNKNSLETYFSNWLSAEPEFYDIKTQPNDYIVLACDGFWEGFQEDSHAELEENTNLKVAKYLSDAPDIAKNLTNHFTYNISDNISVIVLRVKENEKKLVK